MFKGERTSEMKLGFTQSSSSSTFSKVLEVELRSSIVESLADYFLLAYFFSKYS